MLNWFVEGKWGGGGGGNLIAWKNKEMTSRKSEKRRQQKLPMRQCNPQSASSATVFSKADLVEPQNDQRSKHYYTPTKTDLQAPSGFTNCNPKSRPKWCAPTP